MLPLLLSVALAGVGSHEFGIDGCTMDRDGTVVLTWSGDELRGWDASDGALLWTRKFPERDCAGLSYPTRVGRTWDASRFPMSCEVHHPSTATDATRTDLYDGRTGEVVQVDGDVLEVGPAGTLVYDWGEPAVALRADDGSWLWRRPLTRDRLNCGQWTDHAAMLADGRAVVNDCKGWRYTLTMMDLHGTAPRKVTSVRVDATAQLLLSPRGRWALLSHALVDLERGGVVWTDPDALSMNGDDKPWYLDDTRALFTMGSRGSEKTWLSVPDGGVLSDPNLPLPTTVVCGSSPVSGRVAWMDRYQRNQVVVGTVGASDLLRLNAPDPEPARWAAAIAGVRGSLGRKGWKVEVDQDLMASQGQATFTAALDPARLHQVMLSPIPRLGVLALWVSQPDGVTYRVPLKRTDEGGFPLYTADLWPKMAGTYGLRVTTRESLGAPVHVLIADTGPNPQLGSGAYRFPYPAWFDDLKNAIDVVQMSLSALTTLAADIERAGRGGAMTPGQLRGLLATFADALGDSRDAFPHVATLVGMTHCPAADAALDDYGRDTLALFAAADVVVTRLTTMVSGRSDNLSSEMMQTVVSELDALKAPMAAHAAGPGELVQTLGTRCGI